MPDTEDGSGTVTFGPTPSTAARLTEFDPEALYIALDRERRRRRVTQRELLRQAGITTPSTMTRLGQGFSLNADTLVALLTWLGETDLAPYIRSANRR